jgi:hypothetical protein
VHISSPIHRSCSLIETRRFDLAGPLRSSTNNHRSLGLSLVCTKIRENHFLELGKSIFLFLNSLVYFRESFLRINQESLLLKNNI